MSNGHDILTLTIDNRPLQARRGTTILQAAQDNDIYIPTLCAHRDLAPFGGCRMCIVEVEGMRGFPTSCTTPVEQGMTVRTHTAQIQAVRQEVLQLILSEHTASCLICDEKDECKLFSVTVRKTGVTTGCRWCPNDGRCELQQVTEWLGLREIGYPIYYRGLPVEKNDPFYDRDYNLCILCGRCVRMCQEVRAAGTLAFCQRGRRTVIGPAFGRTHMEAGCEFCGACVSVCPTGALAEKAGKWDGKPDREAITTCPFCGVGCGIRLSIKENRVICSLPADDAPVNKGQLCVKGRFCVTELVHGPQRLARPYVKRHDRAVEIPWTEAIDLAAEKLSACSPENFGMVVSPNLSNEDLYIAQKFTRAALHSSHIDSSARTFYGAGFNAYMDLLRMAVPLADLSRASVIVCFGLDARFGRSVVGVELRRAMKRGAKIVTINPQPHNLSMMSEIWLQPTPGTEVDLLRSLVQLIAGNKARAKDDPQLANVAQLLSSASSPVLLVGPGFLQYDESPAILEAIVQLARTVGAGVLPLPAQNNLRGSILMGAYPELLPGGFSFSNLEKTAEVARLWGMDLPQCSCGWNSAMPSTGSKFGVLYLIGETLPRGNDGADFVIYQNIYPPDAVVDADLVLPAASFAEVDGTFTNGEGHVQRIAKAVNAPGEALPDWQILCRIAQKMGARGFDFPDARAVHEDISSLVPGFGGFEHASPGSGLSIGDGLFAVPQMKSTREGKADKSFPLILSVSVAEHVHRGFPIAQWVGGARTLFPEGIVEVNPVDAASAGIGQGDMVVATSRSFEKTWMAALRSDLPEGTLHVVVPQREAINPNPDYVRIRKADVQGH